MSVASFKDYFSSTAQGYAQHRPRYPKALAAYLSSLCAGHGLAVDIACGTGQLSTLLAAHFQQVLATDASAAQIEQAETNSTIDYQVLPAHQLPLDDGTADLITIAQAAHWLPLAQVYAEVQRVAKPKAVFALVSYGTMQFSNPQIHRLIQYFYHEVVGAYWPPERQHIVDGYRHLDFPFEELGSPQLTMRVEWTYQQVVGYLDTWSATTQAKKHQQHAQLKQFYQQLAQAWGDDNMTYEVFWDITVRATRL